MLILRLPNPITRRREYMREKMRQYRRNKPKQYSRYVEHQSKRRKKFRDAIVSYLGACCSNCGNTDVNELEIIKVNRDQWRQTLQNKSHIVLWRIFANHPDDARSHLRVLCVQCRYQKKFSKVPEPQQTDQLATECGHL